MINTIRSKPRSFGNVEKFVEPCILLLLSKNPAHGYGLMDGLEKHCGHKVDIGNLYRTLRKMESNKWISSDWKKNKMGPDKRTYHITTEGKTVLHKAVTLLSKTYNLLSRFLEGYQKIFGKRPTL
jgi:PadR family transcriptional regulator PadR